MPDERKKYHEDDAAKDTDSSMKDVRRAWHDAREDAQAAGELPERAHNKSIRTMNLTNGRGRVVYREDNGSFECLEIEWDGSSLQSMTACNGELGEGHETWEIEVGGVYDFDSAFPPNHHLGKDS